MPKGMTNVWHKVGVTKHHNPNDPCFVCGHERAFHQVGTHGPGTCSKPGCHLHDFGGIEHILKCKCGCSEAWHKLHAPHGCPTKECECEAFELSDGRTPVQIAGYAHGMLLDNLRTGIEQARATIIRAEAALDEFDSPTHFARFLKAAEGKS